MRLLAVIPHFFRNSPSGRHGSTTDAAQTRAAMVRRTVLALHQTLGQQQAMIRHADRTTTSANDHLRCDVHVILVTTPGDHLLSQADLPEASFHQQIVDDDPALLGFHCHEVLRNRWGNYDYYGYLEDDLWLSDPWFVEKLRWFNSHVGNDCLLMPNRYEVGAGMAYDRCYVDGDLAERVTAEFQKVRESPELKSTVMGRPVRFTRPLNPHSGCFFLNADQMRHWTQQTHFGKRDRSFIGPLESAATLGVMRTFKLYKPAAENANFLEIQHAGNRFLRLVHRGER